MKRIQYTNGDIINGLAFVKEVKRTKPYGHQGRRAIFRCRCGKEFEVIIASVVSRNTISCGCWGSKSRSIRFTQHGLRQHPIYRIWCSIKTRCYNANREDFPYYGGRGIQLDQEFINNFQSFFDYVSILPNYENRCLLKLTLDRIDNNGNYTRGNLRWVTRKEQAKNRRGYKTCDILQKS